MDDNKLTRKTVTSHQQDNVKREDDMTASSHAQDTAGGGRGISRTHTVTCQ